MTSLGIAAGERRRVAGDLALLGLALSVTLAARGAGWTAVGALATAALPVGVVLAAGHVAGRGAVAGCLALAAASTTGPGGHLAADAALLVGLAAASAGAGAIADRMAAGSEPEPAGSGRWVTIVVECDEGPADTSRLPRRPPAPPRPDPERRSLARLARGRRRAGRSVDGRPR